MYEHTYIGKVLLNLEIVGKILISYFLLGWYIIIYPPISNAHIASFVCQYKYK